MERAQKELMDVLLGHILSLGLISKNTYSKAVDLVYSVIDLPELFQDSVCLNKEEGCHECTQNTQ